MAARADRGRGAVGRATALVATLLALPLAYLVVRVAISGASGAMALSAASLPPRDYATPLKAFARLAQIPQQKVTAQMEQVARSGLATAPLAFEPFFIEARAEEQRGRLGRAIQLMEEARRRRPTYSPVRMQLLTYYTRASSYGPALTELDLLLRRNADLRQALLPQMVKLITIPEGRQALASLLVTNPEWRAQFFAVAADQKVSPRDARLLYDLARAAAPKADLRLERELVFQALASTGQYRAARQEWLAASRAADPRRDALLFNGAFAPIEAAKPFGWHFYDIQAGRAEITRDGNASYLDISYFGGDDALLAEQTLALAPGSYTLRVTARSDSGVDPGRLVWNLSCLPSGADLAAVDLGGIRPEPGTLARTFTVPGSCAGQKLSLVGRPGDTSSQSSARVDRVEIVR